ncbi:hypothetical protein B0H11DRAFT_2251588 [Mycena galericulata]|nr:hypothetical protein B0H11DRAFT_2251588 [Mycena galericulata]
MRSTRTIINATVKSKKKRSQTDPYGGNERPGKKAKSDAIGPPDDDDDQEDSSAPAPVSLADGLSSSSAPQAPLRYLITGLVRIFPQHLPASLGLRIHPFVLPLPQLSLRALCLKYDVNTTRANDGMVANLRQHYQDQQ